MATPVKWGAEFLVNTTTTGEQSDSAITALANGRFIVTWTDSSQSTGDNSGTAIRGQLFKADGSKLGSEFIVNTAVSGDQLASAITALDDGRFVVSWTDFSQTGSDTSAAAIRAQIFNGDGSQSGGELLVNTTTANSQSSSAITTLADGRFVVSWTDFSQSGDDTSNTAIRAQIYNANGTKSGGEFVVNSTTASFQTESSIKALSNGRFVVSWTDFSQTGDDTSNTAIRAQIFNADGSRFGTEFVANSTTAGFQTQSTIAALAGGRFVVTWTDASASGEDTSSTAIRGQVFNANGTRSGTEFLVNTTTSLGQSASAVTALLDGRFIVTWDDVSQSGGDSSGSAIRGQLFNSDGSKSGGEFLVNTTTDQGQYASAITALADGRFVVSWEDASQSGGDPALTAIRSQIFDPREAAVNLVGTTGADEFHGTAFNDVMTGRSKADKLYGGDGGDDLRGGGGNDRLEGGTGADQLSGGAGDDVLDGGAGADVLNGGLGDDRMIGRGGNDIYILDSVLDVVVEAANGGSDTIITSAFSLDLADYANVENARLQGNLQFDLTGNSQANVLTGNNGSNTILGLGSHDTLYGMGGNDRLEGGDGSDYLDGGNGGDTLIGGAENDLMFGGAGNDRLEGGTGDDRLDGGAGSDRMTGGSGADVFVFAASHDTARVTDFEDGIDRIDLASFGFANADAAKAFAAEAGADVVFTFSIGNVLTVDNMTLAQFTDADFILA